MPSEYLPQARQSVRGLGLSRIREVANLGFGQADVLKFWFGESDRVTPDYIQSRATSALREGRTFYTHNNGDAALRKALSTYLTNLHAQEIDVPRLSVTSSGVSALMIAMQALLEPGDRVVMVTPVWPNISEMPSILSAHVERVALTPGPGGWRLDFDKLIAAITPTTRVVVLNSPGNPTGWILPAEVRMALLSHCRRLGVWILSDDVYERLIFDPEARGAPSFLQIADPEDRLMSANSFSKAWLMTGWRLGWLVAPSALETDIGKLIEYNTSCAPAFVQDAAVTALEEGEPHIAELRGSLRSCSQMMTDRLRGIDGVEVAPAAGGMYIMFRLAGQEDAVDLCKRLIGEAAIGLAPGEAFGPEAAGWVRWCVATQEERLLQGVDRLSQWICQKA